MWSSTLLSIQPDPTEGIGLTGSNTAPALRSQETDSGAQRSNYRKAESPAYYLYFLTCAARTEDLAGLFKVGITNDLPRRYRQHTDIWKEFDLLRSARLRVNDPRQVKLLEKLLKISFADWRRYPGCGDSGYTEFFATACFDKMLSVVDTLSENVPGAQLSRGIDPQECAPPPRADEVSALVRKQRGEARAQQNAREAQERAERGEHIAVELDWVLYLVEATKDHLVWVNVSNWYELLTFGAQALHQNKVLVDLYFGRFHPTGSDLDDLNATAWHQPGTRPWFAMEVERYQRSAVFAHSPTMSKYRPKAMFHVREPLVQPGDHLPHPVCADTLLVRVECGQCIPAHSFLAKFEDLAQRVGSYRSVQQLDFNW